MEPTKPLPKLKTIVMYTTIALLVLGGLIGIFMIFFGAETTLLQCLATIGILYLMALLSANNFSRSNNTSNDEVRICSSTALVLNLFWGLPWILIVWGIFGTDYNLVSMIWCIMWTFLTLALYFTLLSTQIPIIKYYKDKLLAVRQAIPAVLFTYIAINAIVFIWTTALATSYFVYFDSISLIFKFIASELILLTLQAVIPSIILRSRRKQQATPPQPIPTQPPAPAKPPEDPHKNK